MTLDANSATISHLNGVLGADPRLLLVVVEGKNLSQVNFNGCGLDRSNNKKKKVK